ncbi:MAG: PorV/PorQ family protein [Chloroherpetonaceae bacterium]|nr:PorV/PorQ family protein [Chloroherpetonaceae bacterium]
MKRVSLLSLLLFGCSLSLSAQIGGAVAAYSRMGFGARGIGLGNAGGAIATEGEYHPYYNPAVLGFADSYAASATYGYLPLDRRLNFASFTGKIGPDAAIGFAWVNSGVSDIDGRDRDGNRTEIFSTSENLFILSFARRFSDELSLGISLRGYLASLYEELPNSFSLGFDVGAVYRLYADDLSSLNVGAALADISAKYEWNTASIYGQQGATTKDELPLSFKLAAAYARENLFGMKSVLLAAELQLLSKTFDGLRSSFVNQNGVLIARSETVALNKSETHLKLGAMIQPVRELRVRAGVDRLGLQGVALTEIARFAAGFTIEYPIQDYVATIDYAILFEPYAPIGTSFIAFGIRF